MRVYRPGHPLAHKDGYVLEHRLVAYEAGILADPSLHVHHGNETRDDNAPDNLTALSAGEHQRLHHQPGATVVNQHGAFVIRPPEERLALKRARDRERLLAWKEANPDRVEAARRAHYAANREREVARVKAWKEKQRAKKLGDGGR